MNDLNSKLKPQEEPSNRQFLTFAVDNEEYGVNIMKVMEIRGWQDTTPIPDSPSYMRGVIDLRGVVVPIFDLKDRFGNGEIEIDSSKVVIVLKLDSATIGVLVDSVSDILTINSAEIKDKPNTPENANVDSQYITGLISQKDKMIILLNIEKMFNLAEIESSI